jgi:class 3 adenylate cyclase
VRADVTAVADHLGLDAFEMFAGSSVASTRALMYAGTYPARISKLVLFAPTVRSSAELAATADSLRVAYPVVLRSVAAFIFPSGPPEAQRWLASATRLVVSAENNAATIGWTYDFEPVLANLTMPVLILHRKGSHIANPAQVRSVAATIPGARLVVLDGDVDVAYWDHEQFMGIVNDFLGVEAEVEAELPMPTDTAVILFTDIADSTALTERLGNAQFRTASRRLDSGMRSAISAAGGHAIDGKLLGDGVLAIFSSAHQAIDAALACRTLSAESGMPLHIGVHAGDVIHEGGNVYGGPVNIAARVCAASTPGEILVSDTVRALARTSSGVAFEDRGEYHMKGIAEPQRVFAVMAK